ncbi:CLUMA_CG013028, isoform A [Clunio marinus]|uniref:CLUMA_CG013028, isoform A n=1 Tax=Clunio marinus TaxID=568069 RepID=A0A1J1IL16_9DIPT|nr:CLUMA_CG013028, isoform A [Clunio marinus]
MCYKAYGSTKLKHKNSSLMNNAFIKSLKTTSDESFHLSLLIPSEDLCNQKIFEIGVEFELTTIQLNDFTLVPYARKNKIALKTSVRIFFPLLILLDYLLLATTLKSRQ